MLKHFRVINRVMSAVAFVATFVAMTSANSCMFWYYHQPKMPDSLVKRD